MKAIKISRKSLEVGQMRLCLFEHNKPGTPAWAEQMRYESKLMELFQASKERNAEAMALDSIANGLLRAPNAVLQAIRNAMVPATFAA